MTNTITLDPGRWIDIMIAGHTIRVSSDTDADGRQFLHLGGVDCDLEGEEPGLYYPAPLSEPAVVPESPEG
jgi:hypothetical protein